MKLKLNLKNLGFVVTLLKSGLIRGTAIKLSDRDVENIKKVLAEDKVVISDTKGNKILEIDVPFIPEKLEDVLLDAIQDKRISYKELGKILDEV